MTTIELNAQPLQQLSYIADNENYLQRTIDFISKLVKSRSMAIPRGQVNEMALMEKQNDC